MNWKICLASMAAASLVACGGKSDGGTSGGSTLALVATPAGGVIADGVNTVMIHVEGSKQGPISVRTDRGTILETGTNSARIAATPFDVTLVSCNSQLVAGCSGYAQVSVSDQSGASNRIQVRFAQVEVCGNQVDDDGDGKTDCTDADCAGRSCGTNGFTCSAATPSTCACASGQANETVAQCSASNPVDNDCDGKTGCGDADCLGQACATGTVVAGRPLFGTCKAAGTCTCVATEGTKELSCGDGFDNDCDGLIDCDDLDCQGKAGLPGAYCSPGRPGLTCSNPAATGGISTCTVCAPSKNFSLAQPSEKTCSDTIDNDCDGQTDCGDDDCVSATAVCGANNERCASDLTCRCPDTSGLESVCDDGQDNDCDSRKDCADGDCAGRSCGPNGFKCGLAGGSACACSGNGGPAQPAKETSCSDRFDNDCDGLADCADPDCKAATPGAYGQACATATLVANARCDYFGACACPGGQANETSCGDSADNDCDGLADCADPDCASQTCAAFGRTCPAAGGACSCPSGVTETCNDGRDNNCDGKVDCDESACANVACLANAPSYQCRPVGTSSTFACKDTSNYILTVTAASPRLPADGLATCAVSAYLQDATGGAPVAVGNATIDYSSSIGSVAPSSAVTGASGTAQGKATITFTAPSLAGVATISAQYSYAGGNVLASTTVTAPLLGQISLIDQVPTILGARDSGYQESSELTFALKDTANLTYPAGLNVSFEHQPLGDSYIGASPTCTPAVNPTLCTATGVTDATGKVKLILHSGRIAGVVSVSAKAQAGGSGIKTAIATNIPIVAAKASGSNITLNCTPRNVPALIDQDCSNSNYAGSDAQPRCTVTLGDRYGVALGVATVATFESEAGAVIGSPATTPAYPTAPQGNASAVVKVTGAKLPADVTPHAGTEYFYTHGWDGCPSREHNPRDGLVTVIVKVRGEEGFVDGSNGCPRDGAYQAAASGLAGCDQAKGENFIDLAEPFVDYNDNGRRDSISSGDQLNEPYEDLNTNGRWDGPNGRWDSDTIIWAQSRILYTDYVVVAGNASTQSGSRFYDSLVSPLPPSPTPTTSFSVLAAVAAQAGPPAVPARPATSYGVELFFTDTNFNLPNSKYTYTLTKPATAKLTVAFAGGGVPTTIDSLGMIFSQQYCSSPTPANPSLDCSNQCNWSPCYPVVDLSGFGHGSWGAIIVTGGSTPDGGPVCVDVTGSLTTSGGSVSTTVQTPITVCGSSD